MATIKDVAKHANVGIATVSRVLNNSGFVAEETREIVLAAIETLGYVPNELARSFQKKQTNFIGIIVPSIEQSFSASLLSHLERNLSHLGYFVLLFVSNHNAQKEFEYLEKLKSQQVVGTIITAPFSNDDIYMKYTTTPLVSFDRFLHPSIPCVHIDNYKAGQQLTKRLLGRACKKICFVGFGADPQSLSEQRKQAFIDVCEQEKQVYVISDKARIESDREYIEAVYENNKDCDGFFFACDTHAHIFINIAQEMDVKVGKDIYVVGFDGIKENENLTPPLTTAIQDVAKISQAIVDALMKGIQREDLKDTDIIVEHTIYEGKTC